MKILVAYEISDFHLKCSYMTVLAERLPDSVTS